MEPEPDLPDPDSRDASKTSRQVFEDVVASYIDRLTDGEKLNRHQILAEQPELGLEILENLEAFVEFGSNGDEALAPLGTLGDYTLRRLIGRGGMGVVYEAWENSMDRRVALKVLPAGIAADERALQRFVREAKTAGQLNHPNVVSVYGMGLKEQTPYYAMEYVEGETLAQVLAGLKKAEPEADTVFGKRDSVIYFGKIAEAFSAVADGLQHAHSKGVIHRDIKPSNLILDREGRLRILDFGLAHLEGQESLTASGDFLGTPLYMSPEQARRKKVEVDHRTDIYSLGATLYEMLAGRPPFQGKDQEDTLSHIIERDPVDPRKANPRVPRELETIVLKCLRKDPGDRYGTAEALAQDLRRFVRGDPVEAHPESRLGKLSRRLRRNRIALLAAGVLAVLLGTLGWIAWERHLAILTAEEEARKAARLLHDATVRDAAIELSSGQLVLMGKDVPALGSVLFMFGAGKFKKGPAGIQDTLTALAQAADAVPERPDAPYYLALLYRLAGEAAAAGREAARALERDREFVPAEVLGREIALEQGRLGESEIEPILARFRDRDIWQEPWLLAYQSVRRGDWPEAAEAYGRLLKYREPEPYVGFAVEALMGSGFAHLNLGDFPGSISDFAAACGLWPRLPEARFALAAAWHRAGQAGQAEKVFLDLHGGSPEGSKSEIAAWIFSFYQMSGPAEKAEEWLERIDDPVLAAVRCMDLTWQYRYEECIETASKALEAHPDAKAPLILLAWAKLSIQWCRWGPRWDGERRDALELARKATALYPNDWGARNLLAMALQVNGWPEEALRTIEGAIRLRLRAGEDHYFDSSVHTTILRQQGDLRGAERVVGEALKRHPGNPNLRFELARTYEVARRHEEAEREFRALTDGGGGSAREYSQLAGVLNRLARHEEAAEAAKEALRRLPRNSSAHEELAQALWKLGRTEEALEAAEVGIRELPGRERLHLVRGRILEALGKLEEAAKAYCLELDLRLDDAEAHEALCGLLRKRPDLASVAEVQAVGEAIERRRSAGGRGAVLLETHSLIREPEKQAIEAPAPAGK